MSRTIIRRLTAEDWELWKSFRLSALKTSPENFNSSYEEEFSWQDSGFQQVLEKNTVFGIFVKDELISCLGFAVSEPNKASHFGVLWGMYTDPQYRNQGFANVLFGHVIAYAKDRVSMLSLSCVANNLSAVRFYEKHGFKIYGTKPKALKIEGLFLDAHLMFLDLSLV